MFDTLLPDYLRRGRGGGGRGESLAEALPLQDNMFVLRFSFQEFVLFATFDTSVHLYLIMFPFFILRCKM